MTNQNFKSYLNEKSYEDLKQLWNEYASCTGDGAYIYDDIEEFADIYEADGVELARKVFFGDVKNWGDNVYLDGYENFASCWNVQSSPIDLDVLAEWLEDEDHEVFTEWKDGQPTFEEWLEDTYNTTELLALWAEYMEEGEEFNLVYLADTIADNEGDEYIDYLKELEG